MDEDLIDFLLRVDADRALAVRAMVEDWTKLQAAHSVLMERRSETTAPAIHPRKSAFGMARG